MVIESISLTNFRNYQELNCNFPAQSLIFFGNNGAGKTNLLESICVISILKSFRGINNKQLINNNANHLFIKAKVIDNDEQTGLSYGLDNIGNRNLKINDNEAKKISDYIGQFLTQSFINDDILIITGAPGLRRKLIDQALCVTDNEYLLKLQEYNKLLKFRNICLKKEDPTFYIWDEMIANNGAYLISKRITLIKAVNLILSSTKFNLSALNIGITTTYSSFSKINDPDQIAIDSIISNYKEELIKKQDQDKKRGYTNFGPHRDDWLFLSGDNHLRDFASQGQMRIFILLLKFALSEYMENIKNTKPVLLFDDVLNDLDMNTRNYFFSLLKDYQTMFTSTSLNGFEAILDNSAIFKIENGRIMSA